VPAPAAITGVDAPARAWHYPRTPPRHQALTMTEWQVLAPVAVLAIVLMFSETP